MQKKGSAQAQYAIIIALVALTIGGIFSQVGMSLVDYFVHFKDLLQGDNQVISTNQPANNTSTNIDTNSLTNPIIQKGELGGTPEQPVSQCVGDTCAIDYGDFILNGIPADLNEVVKDTGASGGTKTLLSLIEQIADQLEADGDLAGAVELRDLANFGHTIASVQGEFEMAAKKIEGPLDLSFDDSLLLIGASSKNYYVGDLGKARNDMENPSSGLLASVLSDPESQQAIDFINKYDDIIANDKFSDTVKDITTELYLYLNDIGTSQSKILKGYENENTSNSIENAYYDRYYKTYDPLTGELIDEVDLHVDDIKDVLHLNTSFNSDLTSALICVTGKNRDSGQQCH